MSSLLSQLRLAGSVLPHARGKLPSSVMFLDYSKFNFMGQKFVASAAVILSALVPVCAGAQGLEAVGNRAAAMTAFVAVADDASAVVWNPSGLAQGPFFNLSLGCRSCTRRHVSATAGDRRRRASTANVDRTGPAADRRFVLSHGNHGSPAHQPCRPTQPDPTRSPSLSALVAYESSGCDGGALARRSRHGWRDRQARSRQFRGGYDDDPDVVGRLRICRVARNARIDNR